MPTVELTGEIYVRAVEFSNDSLIENWRRAVCACISLRKRNGWIIAVHAATSETGRSRLLLDFSDRVRRRIEKPPGPPCRVRSAGPLRSPANNRWPRPRRISPTRWKAKPC